MTQRTRLLLDITAWGFVLVSVTGLALYCVGIEQYNDDRTNHKYSQLKGD